MHDKFCFAFNHTLPLVEALYECQRNPFLNNKGEVDLTGGGGGNDDNDHSGSGGGGGNGGGMIMCAETPVAFSLPSAPPGEVDASGLCTLMILRRLERAHNTIVERFQTYRNLNKLNNNVNEQNDNDSPTVTAPAISYLTLPSLSRKALLSYSRNKQLLPILARCHLQPLGDSNGNHGFEFDGKLLEYELSKALR